jgi:hypothetical protein
MNRPTTPMPQRPSRPTGSPTGPSAGAPAGPGAAALGELSAVDFQFLTTLIKQRSAIDLDSSKQYLLTSRLAGVVRDERLASLNELVEKIRRAPRGPLETKVIDAMTTNETSPRAVRPARSTSGAAPVRAGRSPTASRSRCSRRCPTSW